MIKNTKALTKLKRYTGFTLAEVLITLTVIGVVAAMSIPSLMTKIDEQEHKAAWKEAYANISQAIELIKMDNGGTIQGICTSITCFQDKLSEKINFSKFCSYYDTDPNCWADITYTQIGYDVISNNYGAILNNGQMMLYQYSAACTLATGADTGVSADGICALIDIDVNGAKGPNKVGKDTFGMYVLKDRVVPYGTRDNHINTCASNGVGCSSEYLR